MTEVAEIVAADVVVEPAGREALPALAGLYALLTEAHGERIAPEAAAAKLGLMFDAGARAALFRAGRRVIGGAMWMEMGDHVFVRNFTLVPELRGRGLGAALVERLREEAIGRARPVRLEANAPETVAFWEGCGFVRWSTGLRRDPPEEGPC